MRITLLISQAPHCNINFKIMINQNSYIEISPARQHAQYQVNNTAIFNMKEVSSFSLNFDTLTFAY